MTRTTIARWQALCMAIFPLSLWADTVVDEIKVVASTPLGSSVAANAASNVQTIDGEELTRQRALDLTELMNRQLSGVFVNDAQSNPLQPDVQYRGFVGSPLLGLPQGLAVYQDGVRINEPFGDTVNWALIPDVAIDSLQLVPGSNPMFGLNALGGTIAVKTKDGFSNAGTRAEASLGSFARVSAEVETGGGIGDAFGYFAAVSWLKEDGWRNFSGTEAMQAFGSLRWQSGDSTVEMKLTLVNTTLTGNGTAPLQLLRIDRKAVFTHPDDTENELAMLNVVATHEFSDALSIVGNVYARNSDIDTLNGDDSDYEACTNDPTSLCIDGEPAFSLGGNLIPANEHLEGATINRTQTTQDGLGFSLQLDADGEIGRLRNNFLLGVAYDRSDILFSGSTELGSLDDNRGVVPGGVITADSITILATYTRNSSVFFFDTVYLTEALSLGIGGRFNRTGIELRDRIGTALDGDHDFDRFNPSVSLTYVRPQATFYIRYSEASRVPSPVELTCSDENDPCRLPNAFLSDPPLEMVVASTWEAGVRSRTERLSWHAGLFHTINNDDIIFISAGTRTNEGFFDNVGRSRRLGLELNLVGELGEAIDWFLNYTWLDATFRDRFVVSSPNNPEAFGGEIEVRPGDRLPLLPEHMFKAGLTWMPTERIRVGFDAQVNSDQLLRGDEGNDSTPVDGYAVLNVLGDYALSDRLRVFFKVSNLLDNEYETFGLFGEASEVLGDDFDDNRFLSPGAPRGAWLGIELAID